MLKTLLLLLMLPLAGTQLFASDTIKDKYAMFPEAKEGYVRYIIDLSKMGNDDDHKVELFIGKELMVDCNHISLRGKIERKLLEGWGYHYLEVSDIRRGPSTRMACRGPKTEKFISIYDPEKTFIRYNSRLGTVIYVPKGFEVRYRIWSAGERAELAEQR